MATAAASPRSFHLSVGTPEQFLFLHHLVKAVLILNLLDALFTLVWVRAGFAHEANTLIDELVRDHAVAFVSVKMSLVGLGSWLLWQWRERPLAVVAIFVSFMAYYLVVVYHIQFASGLLRQLF